MTPEQILRLRVHASVPSVSIATRDAISTALTELAARNDEVEALREIVAGSASTLECQQPEAMLEYRAKYGKEAR